MDALGDASILKSSVRQVHSCIVAALQAADGDMRTGPELRGTQEVQLVYPLMTVCPYSPSVLASDVQRKRRRTPGTPSVGNRRDRRHRLLFRQQRPRRCAPLAKTTTTSFGGLVCPVITYPVLD